MNDDENTTKYKEMYKTELNYLDKYINNKYIYDIILHYKITINDVTYTLHSNINVYEMIFLGVMAEINNAKDILEIGCAYGTSGMVLINSLIKNGGGNLTSIDPYQTTQWKNVGKYNIDKIIELNKNDIIVKHELIQELSSIALNNYVNKNKYFDLIFIDGSHSYLDVLIDIFCSIKLLKKGGLMILDDVLHTGVKQVINELKFMSNMEKVHLVEDDTFKIIKSSYFYNNFDKSYTNPRTMYAYKKN